jgi:NAD(P)H-hydrate epimerase
VLNRAQVREVDRRAIQEYGMSGLVLMENAGRGVADNLCDWLVAPSSLSLVCCGKGNNGGDGFVVARHLDLRCRPVKVLLFANPAELTGDAAANYRILKMCDVPIDVCISENDLRGLDGELATADWIVDALLGTGATGEPRFPYDVAIDSINRSGKPVCAVDLPSGLDCDTGAAATHTIRAAKTCTFVAMKPAFLATGASQYTGEVRVLDIGAPRKLVEHVLESRHHAGS